MMTVVRRWELHEVWPTNASHLSITKGAPLEVLGRCTHLLGKQGIHPMRETDQAPIVAANDALSGQGFRVLALAFREGGQELLSMEGPQLERSLVFVGLTAMLDPPREGVREAIEASRVAGVRVTMLTGDYGLTAAAVARSLGLANEATRVVSGRDIDALDDGSLDRLLTDAPDVIFARATPEHKMRIVQAYQRQGHIVAVTGDGVNDAPALRAAHVGVAMGKCGTDVAREAADVVLLDDNFATIVKAIAQGRAVFANIRLQILAVDLGTDIVPALALAGEPPEASSMQSPPRDPRQPLLDAGLLRRAYLFLGLIEAVFCMCAFLLVWWLSGYGLAALQGVTDSIVHHGGSTEVETLYRASTGAALAAIVAGQVGNLFACRSECESPFRMDIGANSLLFIGLSCELLILLALFNVPVLARVFNVGPLPAGLWTVLALCPLAVVMLDHVWKSMWRRRP
jgi:magnesium-transporting ATPase (P-type)